MIRVALDVMGGDNAPNSNLDGAVKALKENDKIFVRLFGPEEVIKQYLEGKDVDESRYEIIDAPEVIETGEPPVQAISKKKNSSMYLGLKSLSEGTSDAFVSAGSTGALLVGGQIVAGRVKGVKRSPLAIVVPTLKGQSVIVDCGANVDARPEMLVQFAIMGSLYSKHILGVENPTVGLINIGTEEEKGNELTRSTYPLLKECADINFIGNAEARDVALGAADVLVCEAFTGNVVLKMYEGVSKALLKQIKAALKSTVLGSIGGLMIKPSLKGLMKTFDSSEDGGAPMLGLNGLVVKAHGNSTDVQIKNAIIQCIAFKENDLGGKIQDAIR